MSTESATEVQAFYQFLGERIATGQSPSSPEESVSEYRAYCDELRRLRAELAESHQQLLDGKAAPLDVDKLMREVRGRVAEKKAAE